MNRLSNSALAVKSEVPGQELLSAVRQLQHPEPEEHPGPLFWDMVLALDQKARERKQMKTASEFERILYHFSQYQNRSTLKQLV